ncbi:MAG: hypothetical protein NVSMB64_14210 [Candidatus Velthaea sp.]
MFPRAGRRAMKVRFSASGENFGAASGSGNWPDGLEPQAGMEVLFKDGNANIIGGVVEKVTVDLSDQEHGQPAVTIYVTRSR